MSSLKPIYEAVVVGAGPAGCSAAIHLQKLGINTLLLDKSLFPRDKVCGDGIPLKCHPLLKELDIDTDVLLDQGYQIRQLQIHSPRRDVICYGNIEDDSSSKSFCMRRRDFDLILLDQAKTTLNQVHLGTELISIKKGVKNTHTLLLRHKKTEIKHEISTRMIIGADGVHSTVSREKRLLSPKVSDRFFGLRAYCSNDYFEPIVHIIYDRRILPGYVWLFPVSKTKANVGMIVSQDGRQPTGRSLRDTFKNIVSEHPVFANIQTSNEIFNNTRGFYLSLGTTKGSRVKDGVILVGDAGSFINPLTGGGIYNAILTGKHAALISARCLRKNDLSRKALKPYDKWWRKTLSPSFFYSNFLARFLSTEKNASWLLRHCARNKLYASIFVSMYGNPLPLLGPLSPRFLIRLLTAQTH